MQDKGYASFTKYGNKFVANRSQDITYDIKPGVYTIHFDGQRDMFWFEMASILSDEILDLPSGEYDKVVEEMNTFLKPETRAAFKKYGYVYKRSALLYGLPGTGKTVITQRLIRDVIAMGGIVLYVKRPALLEMAYTILKDIVPEMFTMVVFEEFDNTVERDEESLLSLLDGEIQKDNVIYLATTNFIDRIPPRLRRPGRFSSVIEVKYPTAQAREFYFNTKLNDQLLSKKLAEKTEGLSIDELKEVIQAHIILNQDLDMTLTRIQENKKEPEIKKKEKLNPANALKRLLLNDDMMDHFEEDSGT